MPIAQHSLTSGSGGSGTQWTTASISPGANRLVLLTVLVTTPIGVSAAPSGITVTGAGLTWVEEAYHGFGGSSRFRLIVMRAQSSTPSSGTVSIQVAGGSPTTHDDCSWSITEFSGVAIGNNGADAIAQQVIATDGGVNVTSLAPTLAPFGSANNRPFGFVGFGSGVNVTAGASFVTIHALDTGSKRLRTTWKDADDVNVSWTFSGAGRGGAGALELVEEGGQAQNQLLVPEADVVTQSWQRNPASGSLASAIAQRSEAAVITLNSSSWPDTARFKLTSGQTPIAGDRTFRARVRRVGPANTSFQITLREGGGSTIGSGTLRGTITTTRSADGWVTVDVPISSAITNYADLYLEVTAGAG